MTDFSVLQNNATPGTAGHLLGTDQNGFDILSRLVWGGRVSLIVAFGVLAIGMTVGGAIGLVAGYARGRVESLLMGVVDILLAFPALILLIAIVAFMGADLVNVVLGISLVSIPAFARIARATTLTFASRDFVLAATRVGGHQPTDRDARDPPQRVPAAAGLRAPHRGHRHRGRGEPRLPRASPRRRRSAGAG